MSDISQITRYSMLTISVYREMYMLHTEYDTRYEGVSQPKLSVL